MTHKLLIAIGIIFMICGAVPLSSNTPAVTILQGLVYIVSGLFAFAAVMRGEEAEQRFSKTAGIFYAALALAGLLSPQGKILGVFMVTGAENILNVLFAVSLLTMAYGAVAISLRIARTKISA